MTIKKSKDPNAPKRPRGNPNIKKGVQPPWLKEHSFAVHPERINKYGVPGDVARLKEMLQSMGNETITVSVLDENGNEVPIQITRFERILLDWFSSHSFDKQKAIIEYGIGKIKDSIDITTDGKPLTWQEFVKSVDSSTSDTDPK